MDITKVRWKEQHGSIFTEDSYPVRLEFKHTVDIPVTVALNVGKEIADHIVAVHTLSLKG